MAQQCGDAPGLREQVKLLLKAHVERDGILDRAVPANLAAVDGLIDVVTEQPGESIGPYRIVEKIGEGGMGVVYLAEQVEPVCRRVALKVIKPGMDSRQVVARFRSERQALAMMSHPNIARVLDGGATDTGRPYFVMELVQGRPINQYCNESKLGLRARLQLFVTVCRAVQHAHQKGVIHRDLKPNNVLVELQEGVPVPKVIDFGVAKAINQELASLTVDSLPMQMVGTPIYMSPEQAHLSGQDIDTRSDVYSLGVMLYELLTGVTPFDRSALKLVGVDELRRMIREDDPPRPSCKLSTLHGEQFTTIFGDDKQERRELSLAMQRELDWIVMKALEKNPNRRYESASALAHDIQRYLNNEPVDACPPTPMYRLRKSAARHKRALTAAGLVAISMAAGLVTSLVFAVRALESERSATEASVALAATTENLRETSNELRSLLYASDVALAAEDWRRNDNRQARNRLARHIPESGEPDLRGFEWHFLWKQGDVPGVEVASTGRAIYDVAISPDAEQFAVAGGDAIIRVFDVVGERILFSIPTEQGETNGVAYSPDSQRLAAAGDDGTIRVWDVKSRQQLVKIDAHNGLAYQVVFSPDGDVLASCGEDHNVLLWDAHNGSSLGTLNEHETSIETIAISTSGVVAAGDEWARVTLWDLASRRPILVPEDRGWDAVSAVSFSSDGLVAHGTVDGRLSVADMESRSVAYQRQLANGIQSLDFTSLGSWLAVGDRSGHVLIVPVEPGVWDLGTTRQWPAHDGRIYATAITPDARRIITAGADGRVMSWKPFAGAPARIVRLQKICKNVAALPDGRIAVGADGGVLILDRQGEPMPLLHAAAGECRVECAASGGLLMALSEGEIIGWSAADLRQVFRFACPGVLAIDGTPDGRSLVIVVEDEARDRTLQIRDVASGDVAVSLPVRSANTFGVSPDGRWLAFDSNNRIRLYDLATKQFASEWDAHGGAIRSLRFSPEGARLVSVSADRTLKTWSLPGGNLVGSAVAHRTESRRLAISPDGGRIATGGDDRMLRLWDAQSLQLLWEHPLQFGKAMDLCFTGDSKRLLCLCGPEELLILDGSPADQPPSSAAGVRLKTDN